MDLALKPGAPHQAQHAAALREGLARHGVGRHRDFVAVWGWRGGQAYRAAGREVLVLERGYLGDRFAYTSIGWNGLNGRAEFPACPDDGGARFRSMGLALAPWQSGGDYVLIVGQVPGDAALHGKDLRGWYADQARKSCGLPVRFRPHPLAHKRGPVWPVPGTTMDRGTLADALAGAAVVVTYNSNAGVDAVVAGRRATCDDEGSMIWGLRPEDRERWAHRLAWKQWSLDEIRSGVALEGVVRRMRNGD